MLDFNTLAELSRTHCISLCAFLVPANLIATSLTIVFAALRRPKAQVWQIAGISNIFALVMLLHVFTWFSIGVVRIPTYVLLWLASTCLLASLVTILFQNRIANAYTYIKVFAGSENRKQNIFNKMF